MSVCLVFLFSACGSPVGEWTRGWVDGPNGPEEISYVLDADGHWVTGGDMLLTETQFLDGPPDVVFAGHYLKATTLWPNGKVPVEIHSDAERPDLILAAMNHWNSKTAETGVSIIGRNANEPDYVKFIGGDRCASNIGRVGGGQPIYTHCGGHLDSYIHEIGHAVGLQHEHQRSDRDKYIVFYPQNVVPKYLHDFDKRKGGEEAATDVFDFQSVMFYASYAGSNGKGPVMTTVDGRHFGRGKWLSAHDVETVKHLYGPDSLTKEKPAVEVLEIEGVFIEEKAE